jgi:hypothetical protein
VAINNLTQEIIGLATDGESLYWMKSEKFVTFPFDRQWSL